MSAQPVAAAAVQRVPYFQAADTVDESQFYATAMKGANDCFKATYQESFSQLAPEMDAITEAWTPKQATATAEELTGSIDDVIKYEKLRLGAEVALAKIQRAYEEAIAYCAPPALDSQTLKTLRKMNVNVQQMEVLYVKLFDTQIKALRDQLAKVIALSATIERSYHTMKQSMEPVAFRLKAGVFGSLSYGVSWGGTPYVDAAREARKKETGAPGTDDFKEKPLS